MEKMIKLIIENKIIICVLSVLVVGYFIVHHMEAQSSDLSSKDSVGQVKSDKKQTAQKHVSNSPNKMVVIDVQGAVNKPGVYKLPTNSIVQDGIDQAGGMKENADAKQVNRALKLTDSMQVYIPAIGESNSKIASSTTAATNSNGQTGQLVNINTAKAEDFKDVKGIGPKKAQKIIDYREKNGNYSKLDDLSKVGGFGAKTIENLKDSLTV